MECTCSLVPCLEGFRGSELMRFLLSGVDSLCGLLVRDNFKSGSWLPSLWRPEDWGFCCYQLPYFAMSEPWLSYGDLNVFHSWNVEHTFITQSTVKWTSDNVPALFIITGAMTGRFVPPLEGKSDKQFLCIYTHENTFQLFKLVKTEKIWGILKLKVKDRLTGLIICLWRRGSENDLCLCVEVWVSHFTVL